jgi:hypothetical protein
VLWTSSEEFLSVCTTKVWRSIVHFGTINYSNIGYMLSFPIIYYVFFTWCAWNERTQNYLSVCVFQLENHWMDFDENLPFEATPNSYFYNFLQSIISINGLMNLWGWRDVDSIECSFFKLGMVTDILKTCSFYKFVFLVKCNITKLQLFETYIYLLVW